MLFIFGTKTLGTTLKEGNFYCARCAQDRTYQLKSNRRFFSIFFIPLIPLNKVGDTVECTYCKTAYIPNAAIIENYVSTTAEVDQLAKPLASYGKRLGGYVIDIILLTILIFPLSFVAVRFQKYLPQNFIIVFTTMWVIYFFLMEWLLGATVGKKFLGIRSVSEQEDSKINVLQHALRAIIKCIPIVNIILLFNAKRKGVHDFAANTIVVEK